MASDAGHANAQYPSLPSPPSLQPPAAPCATSDAQCGPGSPAKALRVYAPMTSIGAFQVGNKS
jgi:hypothetical protein